MNAYDDNIDNDNLRLPDTWLFLRALRAAFGRVPLWLTTWGVLLLLSLVPALMTAGWFAETVDSSYPDARTVRDLSLPFEAQTLSLDAVFREDHEEGLSQLSGATGRAVAVLGLLAMLLGAFFAGGWLQVTFERTEGRSLRRFFLGGGRYFLRFVRVLVLTLLVAALVHWFFYDWPWKQLVIEGLVGVPEYDRDGLETLGSELQVARLGWVRDGLAALAFALLLVWGVYTRTRLALRDGRSALAAGIATIGTILRHPVQTLRPLLLLFLVEALLVVLLAGWLAGHVEGRMSGSLPRLEHVVALAAIGQLALAWRQITRGATYHAAGRVSQALLPPTDRQPDPWRSSIGGPGGPQYPVFGDDDDDDGYHVAM